MQEVQDIADPPHVQLEDAEPSPGAGVSCKCCLLMHASAARGWVAGGWMWELQLEDAEPSSGAALSTHALVLL